MNFNMVNWILSLFSGLSPEIATALLAIMPVGELRLSMPIALTVFHLPPATAFAYSYLGNVVPLILVYLFLPPLLKFATAHSAWLKHVMEDYFLRLERKHKEKYDRYGRIIVMLFVAVPIPGSGVWTGAVLSILFGVEKSYAIPAILVGLAIAGVIVLLITQGTLGALNFLLAT